MNGCSACSLLVEIICFCVKTSFLAEIVSQLLGVIHCLRVTPICWWTPFWACFSCYFLHCPFFFLTFFSISDGKRWKSCFNAETNDFNQWKACGAPVFWSKYTAVLTCKNCWSSWHETWTNAPIKTRLQTTIRVEI